MTSSLIERIKENEVEIDGIPYLHINNGSKSLVVVFAGATRQYNLVRDLIDNSTYDYLWLYENDLLGDGYFRWYSNPIFREILGLVLAAYETSNIFFVGSSMGGYGALKFAIECNVKKIIVRAPQIDFDTSKVHFTMSRVPGFADLIAGYSSYRTEKVYYECPNHEPDLIQFALFKPVLDKNGSQLVYNMRPENGHVGGMWNGPRIFNILKFFNQSV